MIAQYIFKWIESMKIEIDDDIFDVSKRLKEIDEGYFVLFDIDRNMFEIHYRYQPNTYCLSVNCGNFDGGVLDLVRSTNIANIDKIIENIDKNNHDNVTNISNANKNYIDYHVREIYDFANNSSKTIGSNLFESIWR